MRQADLLREMDLDLEVLARIRRDFVALVDSLLDARPANGRDFWLGARGLELRSVRYDRRAAAFRLTFRQDAGREYSLPARLLDLPHPVESARLDELRHGAIVRLAGGAETSFSSDLVLYHSEPRYRAAHERRSARRLAAGPRIREMRLQRGRTARDVARATGMAPSNYARLEAGHHEPRIVTLVRVAEALNIPLADLLETEGCRR